MTIHEPETTRSFTDHKGVSYELADGPGTGETEAVILQHHPDGETRTVATGRRGRLVEMLSAWSDDGSVGDLRGEVAILRAELADMRRAMADEVRTRRLVVVDDRGVERIETATSDTITRLSIVGPGGYERTSANLVASFDEDGDDLGHVEMVLYGRGEPWVRLVADENEVCRFGTPVPLSGLASNDGTMEP